MTRETEVRLARIHLNALEHMQNSPDHWARIIDAFSKAAGDDPEAMHRAHGYLTIIENILEENDEHKGNDTR